jgi:hypothetical protein
VRAVKLRALRLLEERHPSESRINAEDERERARARLDGRDERRISEVSGQRFRF